MSGGPCSTHMHTTVTSGNTLPCTVNNSNEITCVCSIYKEERWLRKSMPCRVTALALTLSHSQNRSSVSEQTRQALPATLPPRLLDEEAGSGVRQVRGFLKLPFLYNSGHGCISALCHLSFCPNTWMRASGDAPTGSWC